MSKIWKKEKNVKKYSYVSASSVQRALVLLPSHDSRASMRERDLSGKRERENTKNRPVGEARDRRTSAKPEDMMAKNYPAARIAFAKCNTLVP